MMLRASTESLEVTLTPEGITDRSVDPGIPGAGILATFVEAVVLGPPSAVARRAVEDELGRAALIDAAGCIANFEMMNRIALGTGMPVSQRILDQTAQWRLRLGI